MNRHLITRALRFASFATIVFALTLLPMLTGKVGAVSLNSTPAEKGYIDHVYGGTDVKKEPTADGAESKVWFNDGLWWGILFNPGSKLYEIYRLDWGTQTWNTTGTAIDSRKDTRQGVPSTTVDTRSDVLWDKTANKLYIASHLKVTDPAKTTNADFVARLTRYSYDAGTKMYTPDTGFPVAINSDRTEVLVLDKDSTGRLWVTYVSRVPVTGQVVPYKVFVNYTTTAGDDTSWSTTPIDLTSVDANAATVSSVDAATVIAYGTKVGLLWSNQRPASDPMPGGGKFYYAEHSASSSPANGWTVTPIDIPGLLANDHMKLVANAAGQVFSAIKTMNPTAGLPGVGILARDTNGTFTFHQFSEGNSNDTRPTLALNETTNTLYLFTTSNEAGGSICYEALPITANMSFKTGPCTETAGAPNHFIESSLYHNLDNSTTTKRNFTNTSGLVVMATDDFNGSAYLHNVIGSPLTMVTAVSPANGATVTNVSKVNVTVTFDQSIDPASLTASTFKVSGAGGPLAGTITYQDSSHTATFVSTDSLLPGTQSIDVALTTGIKDVSGRGIYKAVNWKFTQEVPQQEVKLFVFLPFTTRR